MQYSGIQSGYYTGHNSLFDEEWAEKYYITGSNQVKGVITYHAGTNGTYSEDVEYKVYTIGSNGLPGSSLGTKTVSGSSLNISGTAVYNQFTNPISVSDSFFVSFNLGDYAHHNPGTKKIALKHAPDGTRSNADTVLYGRNAIRWHDHGNAVWKDFYKENETRVRVHFAIFPVVTIKTTSVDDFVSNGQLKMHGIYPNPAVNSINLKINSTENTALICSILSIEGKMVKQWQSSANIGENDLHTNISDLISGQYILHVQSNNGNLAQTFLKN